MSDDRLQGEVLRIGVALKSFGVDDQQILGLGWANAILRPAAAAVNMPVFQVAHEAQAPSQLSQPTDSGTATYRRDRFGFMI